MNKTIKKYAAIFGIACLLLSMVACGKKTEPTKDVKSTVVEPEETETTSDIGLEDGVYLANFDTDSTMFHLNDTCDGKAVLTVKDGSASIHIVLTSKNIVNLFEGQVADLDESKILQPTTDTVTYEDGMTEEVNGFDVHVPYLDKEFDLALVGKKGVWYDHKVSVSNPEPYDESANSEDGAESAGDDTAEAASDTVAVTLTGGSGKSTIESPAKVSTNAEGKQIVTIVWSSPHYDYMIVNGEKITPVNTEGNSTFEIQVDELPCSMDVIADTTAMSKPHEIEYTIGFEKIESK